MSRERAPLPTVDRPCPKCGNDKAHGPEYRRGINGDELLGEHLRYYCTVCRYMTHEPTKDQDSPERRAQLDRAFAERAARPRLGSEGQQRQRDIETTYRNSTRRPYGWRGHE
jgi:hypothetical protein